MYFNKNPKPKRKLDRRHYNHKGKVKVSYKKIEDAEQVINNYSEHYTVYLCPICNKWHIGFIK